MKLTKFGKVTITPEGITVSGFEGDGCSCRDVANLAASWAATELSRELHKNIAEPGGGDICVG